MSSEKTHPVSILLVDDDERFLERMSRALERRGLDVSTASTAEAAVEIAQRESPEWAAVDLRMPGTNGLQLVEQLRQLDSATRIVMVTGYGSIATAVDAVRLGADSMVAKPIDADELVAAFERLDKPVLAAEVSYEPQSLAQVEWEHIQRVVSDCNQNISEAARRLGIHRRSLQRKLWKFAP